jgi:CRP/FNR family transcriptional regulator, cyclic AMP receptor protein
VIAVVPLLMGPLSVLYRGRMADTVSELARVPLFSGLSKRQLKRLASSFRERTYGPGITIVREGQMSGVGFFVVVEGTATVSVRGSVVDTVGPGDHFGEFAMITRKERSATVTSETTTRCLVISFIDFRNFVQENGDVAWKLLEHLAFILDAARSR